MGTDDYYFQKKWHKKCTAQMFSLKTPQLVQFQDLTCDPSRSIEPQCFQRCWSALCQFSHFILVSPMHLYPKTQLVFQERRWRATQISLAPRVRPHSSLLLEWLFCSNQPVTAEGEILLTVSTAAPTAAASHGNFTDRVQRKIKL